MTVAGYVVECRGDRVEVSRDTQVVATGRWSGGRIVERQGKPEAEDEAAFWHSLELALRNEAESFVAAIVAAAYDSRGVDVTQIDQMLSLTPRDRLAVLEANVRSILRLVGDVPRD